MTLFLTTARTISVICLWVLVVATTESADTAREGSHSAPRNDLVKGSCYSFCDSRYSSSKSEPWLACHHGCRFLALLGQMAGTKSARDVKHSCLSACTEAYNTTTPEKACHAGCEQMRGRKKKSVPERSIKSEGRTVAPAPAPTVPSKALDRPSIRYFWSKSVVDEQDVDSSSEKRIDFSVERARDPFLSVFNVTYVGSETLPSPPATKRQAAAPASSGLLKEPTNEQTSPPTQEPSETLKRQSDTTTVMGTDLPDKRPHMDRTLTYTDEDWKPGRPHGRPEIMLSFVAMSIFVAFATLFRGFMMEKGHLPLGIAYSKKEEAAGGVHTVSSEDDAESGDEFLGKRSRLVFNGLLPPPSYEQAQQDLNAKQNRPLHVSLDLSTTNNMTC